MYARVIKSNLFVGKADDAVSIWRDKVAPSIKQAKGFKGAYLVGDRGTGKGLTITLWESKGRCRRDERQFVADSRLVRWFVCRAAIPGIVRGPAASIDINERCVFSICPSSFTEEGQIFTFAIRHIS